DEAESLLDEAERRGADPEGVTLEGYLLELRKGNFPPGVEPLLWHRVDAGHPQSADVLEALGQAYLHAYRLSEARLCADRWVERQPDSSRALYFRGLVHESMQAMSQAGQDYRQALQLGPSSQVVRLRLAEWCLAQNQPSEAVRHFQALYEQDPGRPAFRLGLARALRQTGDSGRAGPLL